MSSLSLPIPLAEAASFNPGSLLLPALLVLMMVFMFTRSRRAQQQAAERRNSIAPGMRVLSTAGLYGTVVSRDDETNSALIRIAEGVNVTMHLGTINPAEAVVQGSIPAESPVSAESHPSPQQTEQTQAAPGLSGELPQERP